MEQPIDPRIDASIQLGEMLKRTLMGKVVRVQDKYDYYNADAEIEDLGVSSPIRLAHTRPGIGWAGRAVNTLSDRVVFDGFANDAAGINTYIDEINGTSVLTQAKHDAFVGGCSFVAVVDNPANDPAHPKIFMPFTAGEATGVIDQNSGLLKYGMAVTKFGFPPKNVTRTASQFKYDPVDYFVFTKTFTAQFINNELVALIPNPTGRVLLHPITHRASANAPLGKSRVTNTVRRIIQEVGRQKRREEIAEEFYSFPQRYINGLAQGAKKDAALDSAIGKVWTITADDEGNKPDVGQLAQMSINQFETAKKDKARDFCAETGLTLRNLGYETANPTSAESLSAMSDDLLLEATNSQDEMGKQIKAIAITLRMAIDQVDTISELLNNLVPAWKPIFQVDVGAAGDAVYKLYKVMPELAGTIAGYRMLGVSIREAEDLQRRRLAATGSSFMNQGGTA